MLACATPLQQTVIPTLDTVPSPLFQLLPLSFSVTLLLYISLAAMDPSNDGDSEHFVVQLKGSDRSPRALKVTSTSFHLDVGTDDLHSNKTILRQMFTTRRYNVERDGRLTSLAKAIEWVPWTRSTLCPIESSLLDCPLTMLLVTLHPLTLLTGQPNQSQPYCGRTLAHRQRNWALLLVLLLV